MTAILSRAKRLELANVLAGVLGENPDVKVTFKQVLVLVEKKFKTTCPKRTLMRPVFHGSRKNLDDVEWGEVWTTTGSCNLENGYICIKGSKRGDKTVLFYKSGVRPGTRLLKEDIPLGSARRHAVIESIQLIVETHFEEYEQKLKRKISFSEKNKAAITGKALRKKLVTLEGKLISHVVWRGLMRSATAKKQGVITHIGSQLYVPRSVEKVAEKIAQKVAKKVGNQRSISSSAAKISKTASAHKEKTLKFNVTTPIGTIAAVEVPLDEATCEVTIEGVTFIYKIDPDTKSVKLVLPQGWTVNVSYLVATLGGILLIGGGSLLF